MPHKPSPRTGAPPREQPPRVIAVVAFDGVSAFQIGCASLMFGEDRRELGVPRFDLRICAVGSNPLRTSGGFALHASHGLAALRRADVVIVPSWRPVSAAPPAALLDALRAAHRRGATVVGLCTGAF